MERQPQRRTILVWSFSKSGLTISPLAVQLCAELVVCLLCTTCAGLAVRVVAMASSTALLATFAAIVGLHCVQAFVHTEVAVLSDDCKTRYDNLIASIPAPTLPEDENNCTKMIVEATDNTTGTNCPSPYILIACFQVITPFLGISLGRPSVDEVSMI